MDFVETMLALNAMFHSAIKWGIVAMIGIAIAFAIINIIDRRK